MNTAGLSLEQAPPLHLLLRLFMTAPWFAVITGVILIGQGDLVFASRWTPAALAVTHLIVIGFLGQIMCGVMLQMLPVIVGAPVPGVQVVGSFIHLSLSLGAGLMAAGYLGFGPWLLVPGACCAVLGFMLFVSAAALALHHARGTLATRQAIWLALFALMLTVLFGSLMVAALVGLIHLPQFGKWVDLHTAWGLLGWIGLLIIGVAYQIVPLFHVTPAYPDWMKHWFVPAAAALLLCASGATLLDRSGVAAVCIGGVVAGYVGFAIVTLSLQRRRTRPRLDATMLHWWSAMGAMMLAALGWSLGLPVESIGVLLLVGVGIGLPSGMLFKIVPLLCWFHLQHQQLAEGRLDVSVPHMHGFLAERHARIYFALHIASVLALFAASIYPVLAPLGGVLLALSGLLLAGLLTASSLRYRRVARALAQPAVQEAVRK